MIDVTSADLVMLIQKAYELSRPQGMGMLHFNPAPLTDKEAEAFVRPDGTVHLDYVKGRACKFHVRKEGEKFVIDSPWYDHTDEQLAELLTSMGITKDLGEEHGCACNCDPCRIKRGELVLDPATGL